MTTRRTILLIGLAFTLGCGDAMDMMDDPMDPSPGARRSGNASACAGLTGLLGLDLRNTYARAVPGGVDVDIPVMNQGGCSGHLELTIRPGRGLFADGFSPGQYELASEASRDPADCGLCGTLVLNSGPEYVATTGGVDVLAAGDEPGERLFMGLDRLILVEEPGVEGQSRRLHTGGFFSPEVR